MYLSSLFIKFGPSITYVDLLNSTASTRKVVQD